MCLDKALMQSVIVGQSLVVSQRFWCCTSNLLVLQSKASYMLVKVPEVTLRCWCGSLPHNSQKGTTFILNSNCEFLLAASVQKNSVHAKNS